MRSSHGGASFSYFSRVVSYSFHNDHSDPLPPLNSTQVPIQCPSEAPISVPVHLPDQLQSTTATKIQSAYRAHRIRKLFKTIATVDKEASRIQFLIQRQETVDAVRSNDLEKLRMNEALMSLLLRLDSVPGIDPTVREARRKVSRRIVGLQEILDAISDAKVDYNGWRDYDGIVRNWDDMLAEMEEEVCRERGGDEMERFCAQYLGFRCLQRFLKEL